MDVVKVTAPAKLPRLSRFRLDATLPPLTIVIAAGTAEMLKSSPGTTTDMLALLVEVPLVPVMVSVYSPVPTVDATAMVSAELAML
jgi:hypothetical protein